MTGWVLWVRTHNPNTHPAVQRAPGNLYPLASLPAPGIDPPKKIVLLCESLLDAEFARGLTNEGKSEVVVWSWMLPESIAADLENEGLPVVFGYHTDEDLTAALRGQPNQPTATSLMQLEQQTGLAPAPV